MLAYVGQADISFSLGIRTYSTSLVARIQVYGSDLTVGQSCLFLGFINHYSWE